MSTKKKLKHGGNIFAASKKYNIPIENWTDRSTGISPLTYPVPPVPQSIYARLPYEDPEFTKAVKQYYKSESSLAVAGSQTAIEQIPALLKKISPITNILAPFVGYQEHQHHLNKHKFHVDYYDSFENQTAYNQIIEKLKQDSSHVLIIQPNNPTGMVFKTEQIKTILSALNKKAFLIMDEAFIDASEQVSSIALLSNYQNLIILRSVGKFFGLAGLRLGFVFAHSPILETLNNQIGKWQVSSPTQFIAKQALLDTDFHKQTQHNLLQKNKDTQAEFQDIQVLASQVFISELFVSYLLERKQAEEVFEDYAKRGILLRLIEVDDCFSLIRVGL